MYPPADSRRLIKRIDQMRGEVQYLGLAREPRPGELGQGQDYSPAIMDEVNQRTLENNSILLRPNLPYNERLSYVSRGMPMEGILLRIRRAVREQRYLMTDHALEEADADNLTLDDILHVLLTGEIDSIYTDDPRGERYVVRGDVQAAEVDVVCRFRSDGTLLIIITVYVVD
jgi:hypothetical protein